MVDKSGLAQAGTLRGIKTHFLASFYPGSIFRSADEEFTMILRKFGDQTDPVLVYETHGNPNPRDSKSFCQHYYPDTGICLRTLTWTVPGDS